MFFAFGKLKRTKQQRPEDEKLLVKKKKMDKNELRLKLLPILPEKTLASSIH